MAQDLRELFKKQRENEEHAMKKGHEARFLERLDNEFPKRKKSSFFGFKIAAAILILISIGFYGYKEYRQTDPIQTIVVNKDKESDTKKGISLGDLSPDLKKVETYYVANINLELSKLEISDDTKALVNSFMDQLAELNEEYDKLNTELNQIGPNDLTISALIENLQLRLQLLQKLKKKLNELKSSKNEQVKTNTI